MATEKQIAANRANARRSTGPRTALGKLTSSRNALRHGLSIPRQPEHAGLEEIHALVQALVEKDPSEIKLVAANDVHFLERSHHEAHDVMICIGTASMVHDERRMHYPTEVYFKSAEEMRAVFSEVPDALTNTLRVA